MPFFRPLNNKLVAGTLDNIAELFPYFFSVYITALALNAGLHTLGNYFSWAAFHISVAVLGIASYLSPSFQNFMRQPGDSIFFRRLAKGYAQSINVKELLKIIILLAGLIVGVAWFKTPAPVMAWAAGLFTALYGINFKIPLMGALICACVCLALRAAAAITLAESWAIFSYYLLIIAVFSEVRNLKLSRQHKGII